jgi:D-beta-D-heptose 7-phosphate kinase / D-beta-D-heptose 1-phosphate adenosyltransferase
MIRVFLSGCLDVLHPGHLELLEYARSLGDHLTVSIASDATLRALKREPVFCEHDRWRMVSALRCVDRAFVARGEHSHRDCFSYVRNLRPDVWVIDASDPHRGEKEALAREVGTRIVLNHRPECGPSTTGTIERMREAAR